MSRSTLCLSNVYLEATVRRLRTNRPINHYKRSLPAYGSIAGSVKEPKRRGGKGRRRQFWCQVNAHNLALTPRWKR